MIHSISPTNMQSKPLHWYTITVQVYQGYAATTTQHRNLIHSFNKIGYNRFLKYTGHNLNQVRGEVYLKFPKSFKDSSYSLIHTLYKPSMTSTVISPVEVFQRHRKTYRIHTTHSDLFSIIGYVRLRGQK